MNNCRRIDFAELYRQAFAETEPQRKQTLLREVQAILNEWDRAELCSIPEKGTNLNPLLASGSGRDPTIGTLPHGKKIDPASPPSS